MTSLRSIQSDLQRYILSQDASIERSVVGDERFPARDRLGVYAHACTSRLVEALRQNFPALTQVLGDDQFRAVARAYIAAHPSRFASIRYFGRVLAEFLDDRAIDATGTMLADLARWESALAAAFDGPDAQSVTIDALAKVPAQHWPSIRFSLPGSMQRITLRANAVDWWRFAVKQGAQPAGAIVTTPVEWVTWRAGIATSFRSLSADEAQMLDGALRGRTFAKLCADLADRMAGSDPALRAAAYVKTWCAAGWITRLE